MGSFREYLRSQGKAKSTVTAYSSYALDFIGYLDADGTEVENATAKEVLGYLNHLQKKGQENKTRNIRLNVIKQFLTWQIETGARADNPIAHLKIRGAKRQKLYPILSGQELGEIHTGYEIPTEEHEKAKCNWFGTYRLARQRNRAVLSLLVHQGLTTPEVAKLTLNDLKLKEGQIYIGGGRKSNERTLELRSDQIIELMEYRYTTRNELLKYRGPETDRLFLSVPTAGKSKVSGEGGLQIWKGLTKDIKERRPGFVNLRQLRTSVIVHWLERYNLRQVQQMAGHRYISSTESYLVNRTDDLREDIDSYHPF